VTSPQPESTAQQSGSSAPRPRQETQSGQHSHRGFASLFQTSMTLSVVLSAATVLFVAAATAGIVLVVAPNPPGPAGPGTPFRDHPVVITLPAFPTSYLGAYAGGVPASYAPIQSFATTTGVEPNIALYYSGWGEAFQAAFARRAVAHGAVPLVQIEPGSTSIAAIAAGAYDRYLESYANAVASYGAQTGHGVIIGFAHEPNGSWYPWGFKHVAPAAWVAAWRHIVTVFRQRGADDVTWLWTINIIDKHGGIAAPGPWWPGSRYVTWVGIDGYYYKPSWSFAPLFGPTIKAVRALTRDPVLISETAAAPAAGQPAKIANLFTGTRAYGLLGFVWFDANRHRDWRIDSPASVAVFRQGAKPYGRPAP
jgi:mannan endo-1,4-beta-mannosidase